MFSKNKTANQCRHPKMGKKAYPLRKIVEFIPADLGHGVFEQERLECGHYVTTASTADWVGRTNATRRRCRGCHLGEPPSDGPHRFRPAQ